jgi:hypothetical protein
MASSPAHNQGHRGRRATGALALCATLACGAVVVGPHLGAASAAPGASGGATTTTTTTTPPPAPTTTVPGSTTTSTTTAPTTSTTTAPTTSVPATTTTTRPSPPSTAPRSTTTAPRATTTVPRTTTTTTRRKHRGKGTTTTTVSSKTPTTGVPKVPTGGGAATKRVKAPKGPPGPAAGTVYDAVAASLQRLAAITAYTHQRAVVADDRAAVTAAGTAVAAAESADATAAGRVTAAEDHLGGTDQRLAQMAIDAYTGSTFVAPSLAGPGPPGPLGTRGDEAADADVMVDLIIQREEQLAGDAHRSVVVAEADAGRVHLLVTAAEDAERRAEAVLATADRAAAVAASAARRPAPSLRVAAVGPTVLGPAVLTAAELSGWYASTGERPATTVAMRTLAADYLAAGRATGVRADVAFAQSVVETGYFSFPAGGQLTGRDNNFAGIGACDSCAHGWRFTSARTGATAQMELLEAYASPHPVATPLVGKVGIGGCCRTWQSLSGHWATNPKYGVEILAVYDRMLQWAIPGRLAAAGL